MDTDTVPVTGVVELDQHLDALVEDPNIPLNAKLLDDVELQLTGEQSARANQLRRKLTVLPNRKQHPPSHDPLPP